MVVGNRLCGAPWSWHATMRDPAPERAEPGPAERPLYFQTLAEFYAAHLERADAAGTCQPGFMEWKKLNALETSRFWGTFTDPKVERIFANAQSLYADKTIVLFLRCYLFLVSIPIVSDISRLGTEFDVGLPSLAFRSLVFVFASLVVSYCLWQRRQHRDFLATLSETTRVFLVLTLCGAWFIVYPPIHGVLGIPWRGEKRIDVMTVWSFVLLHLTAVCSCATFKLRFVHSFLIVCLSDLQTSFMFAVSQTYFGNRKFQGAQLWLLVSIMNLIILRTYDSRNRTRFLAVAHRYELADRVLGMARRLRAAQVFAGPSWKADNSVVSLTRIRDDPALEWDRPGRAILELGISSFSLAVDNPSNPGSWKRRGSTIQSEDSLLPGRFGDMPSVATIIRPSEGLENQELEVYMRDWNFGTSAGLWSHLNNPSMHSFCAQPLVTTTLLAIDGLDLVNGSGGFTVARETISKFLAAVENAYLPRTKVPYHNALHAVDVVQTVYAMCREQEDVLGQLPPLALFALVIGAAVHDVGHPGVNNSHLVASGHEFALVYNDRSVLENFHSSTAFNIMNSDPEFNIMHELLIQDQREGTQSARKFRTLIVEMVLATDLTHHHDNKARLIAKLAQKLDFTDMADTTIACSSLLHAADVSNVAKAWNAYEPWIDLLFAEFFAQGEAEKRLGFPVPTFMDRDVSVPEKAQIAFIKNIVSPLYEILHDFIPTVSIKAKRHMLENIQHLERRASDRAGIRRSSRAESFETMISHADDDTGVVADDDIGGVADDDDDAHTSGDE